MCRNYPGPRTILDLPIEIIDQIVSHVVEIPWHPRSATFPKDALRGLFPSATLHVNHLLRTRSLHVISASVLWVELRYLNRSLCENFDGLERVVPAVPKVFQTKLFDPLPMVTFEVASQPRESIRKSARVQASVLFPFNYHSFSILCARIEACSKHARSLTIHVPQLSMSFGTIVDQQILPRTRLFRYNFQVKIVQDEGPSKTHSKHNFDILESISYRAEDIIRTIQTLDELNLKLEATLLSMYEGFLGTCLAEHDPRIGRLKRWADTAGGLGLSDWSGNAFNLDRMKHVRNLHYIEYRACRGYVEGMSRYGYMFAKLHYMPLTNLSTSNIGNPRWYDAPNSIWFGLPDHEFAEMHFARALIVAHLWRYYDNMLEDGILSTEQSLFDQDLQVEAICWAYYAWSLDKDNRQIREFLMRSLANTPLSELHWAQQEILNQRRRLALEGRIDIFGGHPRLLEDWLERENILQYLGRAKLVAKSADVSFDSRRGDEMPEGFTNEVREAQRQFLPESAFPFGVESVEHTLDTSGFKGSGFRHHVLGDVEYEARDWPDFSDVAPWESQHL